MTKTPNTTTSTLSITALDDDPFSTTETHSEFSKLVERLNQGETLKDTPKIACKACHYTITSPLSLYPIQGSSHHVFTNPSEMSFDLQTFESAEGCIISGSLLSQFSWFPGYRWQYAYCKGCGEHLGWHYVSASDEHSQSLTKHEIPRFFGLITDHLIFKE